MAQIVRKIGGYQSQFTCRQHQLLINIAHPDKSLMLFSRLTDPSFPSHLKDIADSILELFEIIKDLPQDKIIVSPHNELILVICMGKKLKEFIISLEKAQISGEECLKKRVSELQKRLHQKQFEVQFFKQQYLFLLTNLQLKPNVAELQRLYEKGNVSSLFAEKQSLNESKLTSSSSMVSSKVGASVMKEIGIQQYKCPNQHFLKSVSTLHPLYLCNICRERIPIGKDRLRCADCDFDVCNKCYNIPPQSRKYCAKNHALIFGKAKDYSIRQCDQCSKNLKLQKGYTCISCEYDVCKDCL